MLHFPNWKNKVMAIMGKKAYLVPGDNVLVVYWEQKLTPEAAAIIFNTL